MGGTSHAEEATHPPVAVSSANGVNAVGRAVARMEAGVRAVEAAVDGVSLVEDDPDALAIRVLQLESAGCRAIEGAIYRYESE